MLSLPSSEQERRDGNDNPLDRQMAEGGRVGERGVNYLTNVMDEQGKSIDARPVPSPSQEEVMKS